MRCMPNGINLLDAFYYQFAYSKINITKEKIIEDINYNNNTNFKRFAFDAKASNIPVQIYRNIYTDIVNLFNSTFSNPNTEKCIAVDGTYNLNDDYKLILNMGYYDITNSIPIDLKFGTIKDRNKETKKFKQYICDNKDSFDNNNVIFIADAGYFSYELLSFLINNNFKFIIRGKGDCDNLNITKTPDKRLKPIIHNIRNKIRIIKRPHTIKKRIYAHKNNINRNIVCNIEINSDATYVTNLIDSSLYSDTKIIDLYKSRWTIETYFKFLKRNFKFRQITSDDDKREKMYYSELIMTYIMQIIKYFYIQNNNIATGINSDHIIKINDSLLIEAIYDKVIKDAIYSNLTNEKINKICQRYVKIIKNKINRSFPRKSKKAYTKWYILAGTEHSQLNRVVGALINNQKLKGPDLTLANKIKKINGKKYG